jgi:exosortase E/protease (VPEID-CTERM system)
MSAFGTIVSFLAIALTYFLAKPQQGLWHKIIVDHLSFPVPTPGDLFFRFPIVILLLLGCRARFKSFHPLSRLIGIPHYAFFGVVGLIIYSQLPFPFNGKGFDEYQTYATAVYFTLAFTLWSFLSASTSKPFSFIAKEWRLIALSAVIVLGFGFLAKEAFASPETPILGAVMGSYRLLLYELTHLFLSPFFSHLYIDGPNNILRVENFQVKMAFECSGFQGLQLITLFGACFFLYEKPFLRKAWSWMALGMVLILLSNLLRVSLLIGIGASGHPKWATNAFHSSAGTLFFAMVASLMIYLAYKSSRNSTDASNKGRLRGLARTDLFPFAIFLFLTLFFRPLTPDHDWSYPLKVIALGSILLFNTQWKNLVTIDWPGWTPLLSGGIVAWLWMLTQPTSVPTNTTDPGSLGFIWCLFRVFGTVLLIPIIEERFFRRYLLRLISFRWVRTETSTPFDLLPCLLSSVAFGLVHQNLWGGLISGLIFSWVACRRKKLGDAIWSHGVANAILVVSVLFFDQWQHW